MNWLIAVLFLVISTQANAVEYNELEVYGFDTAAKHELEFENTLTVSGDNQQSFTDRIVRSNIEANYGVSDNLELATYFDYTMPSNEVSELTDMRLRARGHLFEKDEKVIDVGGFFETVMPRNFRQMDVGFELGPTFEKDMSRWTFRVNPALELNHVASIKNAITGTTIVGDGDETAVTSQDQLGPKHWQANYNLMSSMMYNYSDKFRPHLDWHYGATDLSSMLVPAIDMKLPAHLKWTIGLGFGLNNRTEQRVALSRLEYELYF